MTCQHCDEQIEARPTWLGNMVFHVECAVRMIVGSVGHQWRECSCYGKTDTSEVGLTRRQAAVAAFANFHPKPLATPPCEIVNPRKEKS